MLVLSASRPCFLSRRYSAKRKGLKGMLRLLPKCLVSAEGVPRMYCAWLPVEFSMDWRPGCAIVQGHIGHRHRLRLRYVSIIALCICLTHVSVQPPPSAPLHAWHCYMRTASKCMCVKQLFPPACPIRACSWSCHAIRLTSGLCGQCVW